MKEYPHGSWGWMNQELVKAGNRYLTEIGFDNYAKVNPWESLSDLYLARTERFEEFQVSNNTASRPGDSTQLARGADGMPVLETFQNFDKAMAEVSCNYNLEEEEQKLGVNIRYALTNDRSPFGRYIREVLEHENQSEKLAQLRPSRPPSLSRLLFARVGYMKYYEGVTANDPKPENGGSYNKENVGFEVYNFQPEQGFLFGFVQPVVVNRDDPLQSTINLGRIDPVAEGHDRVENVLVVFVASITGKDQVVVGFYRNATVYRHAQPLNPSRTREATHYNLKVDARNAVLIPSPKRSIRVPRGKGGMGQSNVGYALDAQGQPRAESWIGTVLNALESFTGSNSAPDQDDLSDELETALENRHARASGQGFVVDAELKKQIELHAMDAAELHYTRKGYEVDSSVCATQPYDLLCRKGGTELHVEVKGTTQNGTSVILTRNEVDHAREHPTSLFILYDIQVKGQGNDRRTEGGTVRIFDPWRIDEHGEAVPTHYRYSITDNNNSDNPDTRGK